jgi:hypothetical protein
MSCSARQDYFRAAYPHCQPPHSMQSVRVGSQLPQIAQRSPLFVRVKRLAATNPPTISSPKIQPIAFR